MGMTYEDIESLPARDDARLVIFNPNGELYSVSSVSVDEDGDVLIVIGEEL